MADLQLHKQIFDLLRSTDKYFSGFSNADRRRLSEREAPPETPADKQIAAYLSQKLSEIVPGHTIIVEDGDTIEGKPSSPIWVIDPIDGTIPFMSGIPTYMVSVYELEDSVIKAAFAYNPSNKDLLYIDTSKALCNNQPISVSKHNSLIEARIALSGHALETLPELYSMLREEGAYVVVQEGLVFRSSLVARGLVDATIQIGLKKYESGVVYSLVTKAGGKVVSISTSKIVFLGTTPNVVISNSAISKDLARILSKAVEIQRKSNDK